jgi:hypothetical protein
MVQYADTAPIRAILHAEWMLLEGVEWGVRVFTKNLSISSGDTVTVTNKVGRKRAVTIVSVQIGHDAMLNGMTCTAFDCTIRGT